jgi:hypothetical protein
MDSALDTSADAELLPQALTLLYACVCGYPACYRQILRADLLSQPLVLSIITRGCWVVWVASDGLPLQLRYLWQRKIWKMHTLS